MQIACEILCLNFVSFLLVESNHFFFIINAFHKIYSRHFFMYSAQRFSKFLNSSGKSWIHYLFKSIEWDKGRIKIKNVKQLSHFKPKPVPDYHAAGPSPLYTEVIFTLASPRTLHHIDIEPQLFEHGHTSMLSWKDNVFHLSCQLKDLYVSF